MTASEQPGDHALPTARSAVDRALDLLVFGPTGVVVTAVQDLPEMALKGRRLLEQELRNAHVVGRFAVEAGRRQLQEQVEWLVGEHGEAYGGHQEAHGGHREAHGEARGAREHAGRSASAATRPPRSPGRAGAVERDPVVDRAIPEYDTLSASQVVRRLDALGPEELRAVVAHERAGRGRLTIVRRAEQLLGIAEPPGAPGAS